MGDFFGFYNFMRPGHGEVGDEHYHPFVRFWRRYSRNFIKLINVNLVYALVTLPVYVWLVSQINVITAQVDGKTTTLLGTILLYYAMQIPTPVVIGLLVVSILLLGPSTAALTYFAMDCAWDRPGLIWSRFWSAWKTNWKQALPVGFMDFLVLLATLYYFVDGEAIFGGFSILIKIVWILFALIYALIRVYIYSVMVTVDLPLMALAKNSFILAILKPLRSVPVIVTAAVLCFLCSVADIILVPCFLYSFVAFSAAFLTQPVIEEYLLDPVDND